VIQWDKEDCADMGLIKVDLLGLGMMAVLKDCIELIPRHHGEEVDLAALPKIRSYMKRCARPIRSACFRWKAARRWLQFRTTRPHAFTIWLCRWPLSGRPNCGKNDAPYMRRRQGKEEVTYPHPSLEPVLKRTLGVPLFQEQLLRMAMTVASFTGAEAEELRRLWA